MKKLKFIAFAVCLIVAANTATAQSKIGYISVDNMVLLMPETRNIDSLLQKYQADSLNPQLSYMIGEYNRKDSMLRDSGKLGKIVTNQIKQDMANIEYQVQNWQAYVQQAMQQKQNMLLEPIYRRVEAAIQATAKENGYTHVFNREALLVMPPGDDMLPMVAKKLNVKVPPAATAQK